MTKIKRTFTSIEVVQQQFRRRIWRDIHAGVFLAAQPGIWLWWLAIHLQTGDGFHAYFFTDRVIVLVVWGVLLLTHVWVTRLLNERDRHISALLEGETTDDDETVADRRDYVSARWLEETAADSDDEGLSQDETSPNENRL